MHLSQGDQARARQPRTITKLAELDASDARFSNLGAIERGIADLLIVLEEMKSGGSRPAHASAPVAIEPPRNESLRGEPTPAPAPPPPPQPLMAPPAQSHRLRRLLR